MDVLEQRERVYLRDAGGRVPVLAAGSFVMRPDGIEVQLNLRGGGITHLRGRLVAHWLLGARDCPVTVAEAPGDLVLAEVLRGGRVAVRSFVTSDTGVLMLLLVLIPRELH